MPRLSAPCRLRLTLALEGDYDVPHAPGVNGYPLWLYPAAPAPEVPKGVVVRRAYDRAAEEALARGEPVPEAVRGEVGKQRVVFVHKNTQRIAVLDLPGKADPASRALLAAVYRYVDSEAFQPETALEPEALRPYLPPLDLTGRSMEAMGWTMGRSPAGS